MATRQLTANPRYQSSAYGQYVAVPALRPVITGGDGTTNLTVNLYFIAD